MLALTPETLLEELRVRGALLDGHFRLSSGRHSNRFVQKFRILEDPVLVERVAAALAQRARPLAPTVVVSAAVCRETARFELPQCPAMVRRDGQHWLVDLSA